MLKNFFSKAKDWGEKIVHFSDWLLILEQETRRVREKTKLLRATGIEVKALSGEQKKAIDKIWGRYNKPFRHYSYGNHELYQAVTGEFSPYVVPLEISRFWLVGKGNSATRMFTWKDKNFSERFLPNGRFPEAVLHVINGLCYDKEYNLVSIEEANRLLNIPDDVIVKCSIDSGGGRGVKKYSQCRFEDLKKEFGKNFIVEKCLKQHKDISALNESSVNVVRIMTCLLDGKPEFLAAAIRVGTAGEVTDVGGKTGGKGSVIIGLDKDGKLADFGYQLCGRKVTNCSNGFEFKGSAIPNYDSMVKMALDGQSRLPFFHYVGWDMAVREDGEPVIIEYNLPNPGMIYYQWTNGPLLGTDEKRIHHILKHI